MGPRSLQGCGSRHGAHKSFGGQSLEADTYRSWSWPVRGHTPQQPPAQDRSHARLGSVMRSFQTNATAASAGPLLGGGPAPAAFTRGVSGDSECSEDLTTEALIGAFWRFWTARKTSAPV